MASPRTRRVLAELRPKDDNNVSKIMYFGFLSNTDRCFEPKSKILCSRDVSSVVATTPNGSVSPMASGYVSSARENTGDSGFTSPS